MKQFALWLSILFPFSFHRKFGLQRPNNWQEDQENWSFKTTKLSPLVSQDPRAALAHSKKGTQVLQRTVTFQFTSVCDSVFRLLDACLHPWKYPDLIKKCTQTPMACICPSTPIALRSSSPSRNTLFLLLTKSLQPTQKSNYEPTDYLFSVITQSFLFPGFNFC